VRDLEAGQVFDFATDPGAGYAAVLLVDKFANQMLTKKAREARIASGHLGSKQKLIGKRLEKARLLWADPELTVNDVAAQMEVSPATLHRRMALNGERIGKSEAAALHNQGRWMKDKAK
jgi:hypothetical protein